ncbi:serine/threonine-protein kinase [Nitrospirillum amazonense]|uniref:Serine/threonine protein kinase n=1 Tax=Nitrospirillum amazonense TaxID=28077 RepID=A0A560JAS2_9PROT|nr:serine/threonine-protein kinase [Nitrospirillum amazonense]MDG3442727.1 serine/threonine-protein kinase [Nitrospirillum amazonense]TWB65590.1 serine/threonine protein kinase [Nitrospirillum amazonense]
MSQAAVLTNPGAIVANEEPQQPDEMTSLLMSPETPDELTRFAPAELTEVMVAPDVAAPNAAPVVPTREVVESQVAGFIAGVRAQAHRAGLDEVASLDLLSGARAALDRHIQAAQRPWEDGPEPAASTAPAAKADPTGWSVAPGSTMLNTFIVRTLLARGGMGEIYRVRHRDLKTDQAIKVIIPEYRDDAKIVGLFHEEGRLLQRIRHDAVVSCAGLYRDGDGRSMLVLEYIDGQSLSYFLRRGPLGLTALEALLRRLAAGLTAVHAAGIVHRDVSPDNILLPGDNPAAAKLIDFGVAREMRNGVTPRDGLDFAGKFSFASPEQLGMHGGAIGVASDIYSLGLVIVAAARGEKLAMGQTVEEATAARRQVPDISAVPDRLRGLVEGMLQPDPKRRPTDLNTLLRALDANSGSSAKGGFWGRLWPSRKGA